MPVVLAEDVGQGAAERGQVARRGRGPLVGRRHEVSDQRRRGGLDRGDRRADRGRAAARRPTSRPPTRWCMAIVAASWGVPPAAATTAPSTIGCWHPSSASSGGSGHTRRPARSSCRPIRWPTSRSRGDRIRAVSSTSNAGTVPGHGGGRERRVGHARRRQPGVQVARQRRLVVDVAEPDRRLDPRRVGVTPGREPPVGEQQQRRVSSECFAAGGTLTKHSDARNTRMGRP